MGKAMSYRERIQLESWNTMARMNAITDFIGTEHIAGKRVAELGASSGHLSAWALDMGCKSVVAVEKQADLAGSLAMSLKDADNATVVQADLFDVSLHNIDTYLASGILYHTPRQPELFRMLRSAAVVYVESWVQSGSHSILFQQQADGYRHYLPSPRWIEYLAETNGFRLSRSADIPGSEGRGVFEFIAK